MKFKKLPEYIEDGAAMFSFLADQPWAQWLDSGQLVGESNNARHNFSNQLSAQADVMVFSPKKTLVTRGGTTEIRDMSANETVLSSENPIDLLHKELVPYKQMALNAIDSIEPDLAELFLPVFGGAFGYFSYELGGLFEDLPNRAENDIDLADMAVGIYEVVLVTSHKNKASWLIDIMGDSDSDAAKANTRLFDDWLNLYKLYLNKKANKSVNKSVNKTVNEKSTAASLDNGAERGHHLYWQAIGKLESNYTRQEYAKKFSQVKDYLHEGDAYQINLTQRFSIDVSGDPFASYCRMRSMSPAPYGAYMSFPFAKVLSNSPEQFIEVDDNAVLTSPVKGTMPRDNEVLERDLALANSLENSDKDRAENLMIVDLMRNDLGRVCEIGSVEVPQLFGIESYTNVHHMVSHVRGKLRSDYHALDLLKACFPGGSITGAPKKRAMEIIDELEPTSRGVYCGAIGWVGFGGNMQTNIAIRTITYIPDESKIVNKGKEKEQSGKAYFSAGGGVVLDSKLDAEYQELQDKAQIMMKVVGVE